MTTLLIDDDATLRTVLRQAFELEDMPVDVCGDPLEALERITAGFDGTIVTDVRMPGIDGIELFRRVHAIDPDIPVIVTTGHADVPMVLDALKRGVFDFIPKPFAADHLIASVRRANEHRALVLENRRLRALAAQAEDGDPLIGETAVMTELRDTMRRVALADIDVLIEGETGTGKELVALLLHRWGPRRAKPFVAVNCAALPPGFAEAELFGYAPGVHAQYRGGQPGRIEMADGGTLFLDEVGSMPLSVQGALLRVIEEREVLPIGGERPRTLDLRIVAATNVDLAAAVSDGRLRKDLYYRLTPVQLRVPPLRERLADVPLLFAFFLDQAARGIGQAPPPISREVQIHLSTHDWPGNVRELRSYAQRVAHGLTTAPIDDDAPADLASQIADFEAGLIRAALIHCAGDIPATLARLGTARNTLYDKLKRYGIRPADYR
ncbi:sigma-54-dependent transcriptional regulator [Sphingomonas floccifaciens]|uniref:Sigma-54-dependent transcriptional regulator n=1 Tax=Sphingomonas floccifaciens TaxID=1844115 RepID=A0ABW4NEB5_9SPHN